MFPFELSFQNVASFYAFTSAGPRLGGVETRA